MAVSSVIEGQTRVAATAHRNVNDAMSMVQTAEGALQEANGMLTRIKELATQGANDSMSRDQYYFLVQEMRQIMEELVNTTERTTYNGNRLLGDSLWESIKGGSLLSGLNGRIELTLEASDAKLKSTAGFGQMLTSGSTGDLLQGTAARVVLEGSVEELLSALEKLKVGRNGGSPELRMYARELGNWENGDFANGLNGWTPVNRRVILDGTDSIGSFATPIDPTTAPDGGVEATPLGPNVMTFSTTNQSGTAEMLSNGSPVPNNPAGSGAVVHGPALVSNGSILMKAGTVVSFDWEASAGADAYDVFGYLLNTVSGQTETLLDQSGSQSNYYQPRTTRSYTVQNDGNYKFVFVSGTWDATKGSAVGANLYIDNVRVQRQPRSEIQILDVGTSWQFLSGAGKDDAIRLEGIPIWDTAEAAAERNNGAGYAGGAVKVGALSALYQRIMWLSDPANSPLETGNGYDIFSKNAENIDGAPDQQILNGSGELISALTKSLNELVDDSILQINSHRSYFGSYAGRMEHNIANLAAQSENLTAAGSRIRDTDYGAETASLTRTQILQQAATAMLAQANAMPNVVLALLRQQ
jgi:flagellin-like hook-associated protein FlgL